MSAAGTLNGAGPSAASDSLSLAERMQLKHAAADHVPTVEDTVDEEDIAHPPPSLLSAGKESDTATGPVLVEATEPLSEKALGKQKAREESPKPKASVKAAQEKVLDTKSEDSFPALGGGPKSRPSGPVASAWAAKKPAVTNGAPNGVNGYGPASSATSSRASTPASSILTPASAKPSATQPRGGAPQFMSLPGRHSERVSFAPSQLLPRKELKKPILEVLRDINKRSKATVEMKPGPNGMVYFEGKGPVDAVRQALKDIAKEVGSKQAVKVPIPASVRPYIIGRQGATVQAISKRTGARIQVPKGDETPQGLDEDDSATIDVSIEGDAIAAEMARREIETIVNERTSTVNMRLRDIPAEFYPFIAGPRNAGINALQGGRDVQIKVPHYYSWTHQPPPQAPSANAPPSFIPHPSTHIQLSGERRAVQEVRELIERQVEALRRQITLSQLAINRGQHQFIVGEGGEALHDLLQETGCAVILPPASDDTEMLTVTGPREKIELGMEQVMNLAMSMQMQSVDIARQHSNAPAGAQAHARALTRYLQQREAVAQLEKLHSSRIVVPTTDDGPMTWEVYSRDGKNTIRARSDIINVINAHPPARLKIVDMDPFFHEHLREHHQQRVRNDYGVHILLPTDVEQSSQVVLVYEGPSESFELPREKPSQAQIAAFEQALRKAQQDIMALATGQGPIATRNVDVPPKFQEKVQKFARREQQQLPRETPPIQVTSNASRAGNKDAGQRQEFVLRGPEDRLDDFTKSILAFIESEKQDELERGFTMSFDFPQKYANFLIGKRGENINKLREEFDVDIQVNDGKVELKGPKLKAEAAKSRILAIGKKLEDEATHVLKIKPQYHRELIGSKGSLVNRLQDRYNVRVQFPRSAQSTRDDESVADGASEAGGPRHNRPNQAPDEVIIRGPKKGADEARDELLSLLQYAVDNSHGSAVSVAQSQLPSLIGQGGREMESIREITGAKIDVPGSRESADASGRVEIKIRGTKKQVEDAKKLLEERAKTFDASITKSLEVDKKYHKALIGTGGANIRNIVVAAGGSDDRRDLARIVRFPRQDSEESTIKVEGNKAVVEKIVSAIEAFVNQRENSVTETVEILPEKHRLLIGHGGEARRTLESRFNISLDIPKQTVQGAARSQVKLTGQPQDVEKAKEHILELIKGQEGEEIQIPRRMHHIISDNGQFFRRLRNDHKVTVDHSGQQPPPKPSTKPRSRVNGDAALPLITDDQDNPDNYSWEVIDSNEDTDEAGDIPWVLRGSPDNVAKARAILQKALEQAKQHSATGYLILPDPKTYRHVIGQGGSQINAIRKQTGCKITVPKDQAKGEAIEVSGSKEGVEQAKDIILEVVKNGAAGGNGSRLQS